MINCFWAYTEGGEAGIKHSVKNLGWIIEHRKEVTSLHVSKAMGGGAHFQARLRGDRMYYAKFEDHSIASGFLKHKRFSHVTVKSITGE